MIEQNFSNLTGKILIASPFAMEGNVFHKSLIYVIKHSSEGSVGLIFNHPVKDALANNLFSKIDDSLGNINLKLDIYLGGPVELERGFFLHTNDYNKNLLFSPNNGNIVVSSNIQILKDIAHGIGPKYSLFIIGYTGWNAGQLEFELESNLWIAAEPDHDLIFFGDATEKWNSSLQRIGVSTEDFVPVTATC